MSDNVIDFNDAKSRSEQETCDHEQVCEGCQIREEWVNTLLAILQRTIEESSVDETSQQLHEVATQFYHYAFQDGERSAYDDVMGFAGYSIDLIDGEIEE